MELTGRAGAHWAARAAFRYEPIAKEEDDDELPTLAADDEVQESIDAERTRAKTIGRVVSASRASIIMSPAALPASPRPITLPPSERLPANAGTRRQSESAHQRVASDSALSTSPHFSPLAKLYHAQHGDVMDASGLRRRRQSVGVGAVVAARLPENQMESLFARLEETIARLEAKLDAQK